MKYILPVILFLSVVVVCFSSPSDWEELNLGPHDSLWATSSLTETLRNKEITYGPEALFDGDFSTPWVEGVEGNGIGEGITILTHRKLTGLSIVNGFTLSERLYFRNNRLKDFSISFITGLTAPGLVSENDYCLYFIKKEEVLKTFSTEDSMDIQHISLLETEKLQSRIYKETVNLFSENYPDLFNMIVEELGDTNPDLIMEVYGFFGIRITIQDVYGGTACEDTCISEIELELEDF